MNNPMQMINQFIQFRNSFTGNPQEEVMKLVSSGKMSQSQLNDLQAKATLFQQMMQNMNK